VRSPDGAAGHAHLAEFSPLLRPIAAGSRGTPFEVASGAAASVFTAETANRQAWPGQAEPDRAPAPLPRLDFGSTASGTAAGGTASKTLAGLEGDDY